ncbi:MAG TPA: cyclic nucleotide-binding domain-containing protein [Aestuariivirgaceae bacterium]|nr:cyclic nucleotide-binding domain-containing protein [Aestuariivirgaceae bacterium]
MDELSTYFALNDVPAHLSYVIIAVSYYLTNMFWLRVFAVAGLFLEILYFMLTSSDLYAGIAWDLVFIAINLYQIYRLAKDRYGLSLPAGDRMMLKNALVGLNDFQIASIMKASSFVDFESGRRLTREGEPVDALYFLCHGRVCVQIGDDPIAYLSSGSCIGEIAFLTGKPASATVVALGAVRAMALDMLKLNRLCEDNRDVGVVIHRLISSDLAVKVSRANMVVQDAAVAS